MKCQQRAFVFVHLAIVLILHKIHPSQCAPTDVDTKLCPGIPAYHIRDNSSIFSSLDQRCSTENSAYVFGAMISQYSSSRKSFDPNSLPERWKNIAYLDASSYDTPEFSNSTPPMAPDCIFNQRLAKQQFSSRDFKAALSCNPFELTYCRMDYDASLIAVSTCDCHYLYSVKKETTTGQLKCFAKAGVPCNFAQNSSITDPFLKLPTSLDCDTSLICRRASKDSQKEIYEIAFHGIAINTIAYEYMIENADGYCDCNANNTINALNECIPSSKDPVWYSQKHFVIMAFMTIIFSMILVGSEL